MGQDQGQDQGQGQGQDHLLLQRAALPQLYLVLALTLTLVLTLDLAQITKVPLLKYLCSLLKNGVFPMSGIIKPRRTSWKYGVSCVVSALS